MFTRISTALIALAFVAPTNLFAGYVEDQREKRMQELRSLCVTVVSRTSNSATKSQAARFLELSKLRDWRNLADKTIDASYMGHGTNVQGDSVIFLKKLDGKHYTTNLAILSMESRMEANELEWLIPAITGDAQQLEAEYQAQQLAAAEARRERERINRARLAASAALATQSIPTVEPNPVVYRRLYQTPATWTSFYSATPYYPWARRPFITVGGHFSGHHGSGHHGSGHHGSGHHGSGHHGSGHHGSGHHGSGHH